jgi:hypothetical protein
VTHPTWCIRPADEHQHQSHVSTIVACNPAGDELVGVAVRLHRYWLPDQGCLVGLQATADGRSRWYPLTADQAMALSDALHDVLNLH